MAGLDDFLNPQQRYPAPPAAPVWQGDAPGAVPMQEEVPAPAPMAYLNQAASAPQGRGLEAYRMAPAQPEAQPIPQPAAPALSTWDQIAGHLDQEQRARIEALAQPSAGPAAGVAPVADGGGLGLAPTVAPDAYASRPGETTDQFAQRLRARGMGDVRAGWETGVLGLQQLAGGAGAALGDAVGSEGLRNWGLDLYRRKEEEIKPFQEERTTRLEDVNSLGSAADWAQFTLGQVAPSIVESVGTALIGAAAGSAVPGAGNVGAGVGGLFAKGTVKKYLAEQVAGQMAKGAAQEVAEVAAKRSLAANMGAGGLMFAGSYIQGLGDVYGETLDEQGRGDAATAFLGALPYAALDTVTDLSVLKSVVRGTDGERAIGRYAKAMLTGAAKEGGAESGQEGLLLLAGLANGKEYDSGEVLSRLGNSFAAGALAGGVMGVGGGRQGPSQEDRENATLGNLAAVGLAGRPVLQEVPAAQVAGLLSDPDADLGLRADAIALVEGALRERTPDLADLWVERAGEAFKAGRPIPVPAVLDDAKAKQRGVVNAETGELEGQATPEAGAAAAVGGGGDLPGQAPGVDDGFDSSVGPAGEGAVARGVEIPDPGLQTDATPARKVGKSPALDAGGIPDVAPAPETVAWDDQPLGEEMFPGQGGLWTRQTVRSADGAWAVERAINPDGEVVRERVEPVGALARRRLADVQGQYQDLADQVSRQQADNPETPSAEEADQLSQLRLERDRWQKLVTESAPPVVPAPSGPSPEAQALGDRQARKVLTAIRNEKGPPKVWQLVQTAFPAAQRKAILDEPDEARQFEMVRQTLRGRDEQPHQAGRVVPGDAPGAPGVAPTPMEQPQGVGLAEPVAEAPAAGTGAPVAVSEPAGVTPVSGTVPVGVQATSLADESKPSAGTPGATRVGAQEVSDGAGQQQGPVAAAGDAADLGPMGAGAPTAGGPVPGESAAVGTGTPGGTPAGVRPADDAPVGDGGVTEAAPVPDTGAVGAPVEPQPPAAPVKGQVFEKAHTIPRTGKPGGNRVVIESVADGQVTWRRTEYKNSKGQWRQDGDAARKTVPLAQFQAEGWRSGDAETGQQPEPAAAGPVGAEQGPAPADAPAVVAAPAGTGPVPGVRQGVRAGVSGAQADGAGGVAPAATPAQATGIRRDPPSGKSQGYVDGWTRYVDGQPEPNRRTSPGAAGWRDAQGADLAGPPAQPVSQDLDRTEGGAQPPLATVATPLATEAPSTPAIPAGQVAQQPIEAQPPGQTAATTTSEVIPDGMQEGQGPGGRETAEVVAAAGPTATVPAGVPGEQPAGPGGVEVQAATVATPAQSPGAGLTSEEIARFDKGYRVGKIPDEKVVAGVQRQIEEIDREISAFARRAGMAAIMTDAERAKTIEKLQASKNRHTFYLDTLRKRATPVSDQPVEVTPEAVLTPEPAQTAGADGRHEATSWQDFQQAIGDGKRVHYDYAGKDGVTLWIEESAQGWMVKERDDDSGATTTYGGGSPARWTQGQAAIRAAEKAEFRFTKWKPAAKEEPVEAAPAEASVADAATVATVAAPVGLKPDLQGAEQAGPARVGDTVTWNRSGRRIEGEVTERDGGAVWVRVTKSADRAVKPGMRLQQIGPEVVRRAAGRAVDEAGAAGESGPQSVGTREGATTAAIVNQAMDAELDALFGPKPAPATEATMPETPVAKPARTAGQAATSAVKNVAMGLDEVASGLTALFGGPGRLGAGPAFDEGTYAKAKPLFIAGVAHFKEAGADIAEMVKALVRALVKDHGLTRETVEGMRPYIQRFVADTQAEQAASAPELKAEAPDQPSVAAAETPAAKAPEAPSGTVARPVVYPAPGSDYGVWEGVDAREDVFVEDEGKTVVMTLDAASELRDYDRRIADLEQVLRCVRS